LAERLIERLQPKPGARVLDFAAGSGRNSAALRRAGFTVVEIDDCRAAEASPLPQTLGSFDAAISTHGLLHGTAASIGTLVGDIAGRLDAAGLLYATFGSQRDARFRAGDRIDDLTYAPSDGDERGVAHTYFEGAALRAVLEPFFAVESLAEHDADGSAGAWAHSQQPLHGAVHWFAIAHKR
jgi:hypothetical protein